MTAGKEKYILSIDLGTSGCKTAIVSTTTKVLGWEYEEVPVCFFPNGGAENNPKDYWNGFYRTTKRLLQKELVPAEDIAAICTSSQWLGTVAVDRNGHPLMNAVIWLDARGAKYMEALFGNPQGEKMAKKWIDISGGTPAANGKDPLGHILYIKNEFPDIYQKTYKFLEILNYIGLMLTGQFAASYDSIAGHFLTDVRDINHVVYDDELIKTCGLDCNKFPELMAATDVLGNVKPEIARDLGLSPEVKVVMGSPDLHCAAAGSGAVGDYEGHIYLGTSSWLICHVPFKKADAKSWIFTLPSSIPGKYLVIDEQETAGANINFLRDNILYAKDDLAGPGPPSNVLSTFEKMASKVPAGSNRVIYTPWLFGERTPLDDHTVRAGFFNLSLETTRAEIIRSVYEGVAFNLRWLMTCLEKFIEREMDEINIVGGGANSDLWCQIHADILNRTIRQVENPIQTNARGAAIIGAVAMGYMSFEDARNFVKIKRTFHPNSEHRKIYDEIFNEYMNIYHSMKGIYARLNKHS